MTRKENLNAVFSATFCLLIICFVVTLAVAGTRFIFKDRIAEQEWLEKQTVMSQLIAADSYQEIGETDEYQIYQALDQAGDSIGYIFVTAAYGYGSEVSVMTGISEGKVTAVDILDCSNETPGLGQNVAKDSFKNQFKELPSTPVITKTEAKAPDEIQAVTGATKTSNAVAQAVTTALELYEELP